MEPHNTMRKFIYFFLAWVVFAACSPEKDDPEKPQGGSTEPSSAIVFENGGKDLYFESAGGSSSLGFSTTAAWTAKISSVTQAAWVSLDKTSGKTGPASLMITVKKNDSHEERFAYLEITSGGKSETVKIVQKQDDAIVVGSSSITVEPGGGSFDVQVSSNVDFSVEIDGSWVRQIGSKAMKESTLSFSVEKNDGDQRTARISFKYGQVVEYVTVTQGRRDAIVLSSQEISCSWQQSSFEVSVDPQIDYSFKCTADWIQYVGSKSSTGTLYFSVSENTGAERSGSVVFSAGGLEETVVVIQEKRPEVLIDGEDLNQVIPQTTEKTVIHFSATSSWTAKVMDTKAASDWLSVTPDHGNAGEYDLTIHTQKNEEVDDRTGYIHLKTASSEQVITVTQKQRDALTVSQGSVSASAKGGEFRIETQHNIEYTVEIRGEWISEITTKSYVSTDHYFTYEANPTNEPRTGYVIFRSGEKSETVIISQEGISIVPEKTRLEFSAEENRGNLPVQANVTFQSDVDVAWIQVNNTSSAVYYTVMPNRTGKDRYGHIILLSGSFSTSITFYQSGLSCSFSTDYIGLEGGDVTLTVLGDHPFSVQYDADWITETDRKELSSSKTEIVYHVQPLEGMSSRRAVFEVDRVSEGTPYNQAIYHVSLTLTQEFGTTVNQSVFNFDKSGGQARIEVTFSDYAGYEVEYYIVDGVDWISRLGSRSLVTNEFVFLIDKNQSNNSREGRIEFVHPDGVTKRYVTIRQSGSEEYISVPDQVFQNYLIGHFDTNKDGHINPQELYDITEIDLSGLDVVSLEGIDALPYVTSLKCTGCSKLQTIVIPSLITTIGYYCFYGCSSLTSLVIPNHVTAIEFEAFKNCTGLESITIPDTVSSIVGGAFRGCSNITKISIGRFFNDYQLSDIFETGKVEEVILGSAVDRIPDSAFIGWTSLKKITIPESVTSIGRSAFQACSRLTDVSIPASVSFIGNFAFSSCTSLKNLSIPEGVSIIDVHTFHNCYALESIVLPQNLKSIGEGAFNGCSSLKEISFPNSLTVIGSSAFESCSSLEMVDIPESVLDLGSSAFYNCSGLRSISVGACMNNKAFSQYFQVEGVVSITLKQGFNTLGNQAFKYCESLTGIVLPSSVSSIPDESFSNCKSLQKIDIPWGVSSIGGKAFLGCVGLTTVSIPSSVTSIGASAFSGAGLTGISISDNVTYIGASAFAGCPIVEATFGLYCFEKRLFFDAEEITLLGSVGNVTTGSFQNKENLKRLHLSSGIYSIESSAFAGCSSLGEVDFPSSLFRIEQYAFSYCTSLKNVALPEGLQVIGESAFGGCGALEGIVIPSSVTSIGASAFWGTGIKSISIPAGVPELNNYLFSDCANLEQVALSEGLVKIGTSVFLNCSKLSEITIPDSVTEISPESFSGCI